MSLWTRPRWWALPRAAAMPIARRRKRPTSMGAPRSRPSGSPPGSSSTSMVRPCSRTSSSGRTAQALSSSSFSPYSCASRSRIYGGGSLRGDERRQHSVPAAIGVEARSSAENGFAILRQDLEALIHRRGTASGASSPGLRRYEIEAAISIAAALEALGLIAIAAATCTSCRDRTVTTTGAVEPTPL